MDEWCVWMFEAPAMMWAVKGPWADMTYVHYTRLQWFYWVFFIKQVMASTPAFLSWLSDARCSDQLLFNKCSNNVYALMTLKWLDTISVPMTRVIVPAGFDASHLPQKVNGVHGGEALGDSGWFTDKEGRFLVSACCASRR